jgi:hypothetical protein
MSPHPGRTGLLACQLAIVLGFVLLLRLPFLNHAIQGDDPYYLKGAEHALIDPLHPTHARYVFQGRMVDMRGHPHPPLNSWCLALLLLATGDVQEIPLHAAYILFSAIAALSMLALARRFSDRPLLATLVFLVTPAFVVNGNSLEADLPFLAFWLASIACFVYDRWLPAAIAGILAGLAAYQAVVLTPILAVWLLLRRDRRPAPWLATLAAPFAIGAWQLFERISSGALPAAVLAGYMESYHLEALVTKVRSAVALVGHTAWIVFPLLAVAAFWKLPKRAWILPGAIAIAAGIYDPNPLFWASCAIGSLALLWCFLHVAGADADTRFLAAWVAIFFVAAVIVFFAGSARYLLPIAAPIAILATRGIGSRWIHGAIAAEAALSLLLAVVNYQHWDGYRRFAQSFRQELATRRVWINAEWGLRYYLEAGGGLPLIDGQRFRTGDIIVSSAYAAPPTAPGLVTIAERTIGSRIPLRIVSLGGRSGYSSVAFGLRPFDITTKPLDRVVAQVVSGRAPTLTDLKIGTPEAAEQIVSGITNADRWTGKRAVVILKHPPNSNLRATFYIPPQAPDREVTLLVDGKEVARQQYTAAGIYTLAAPRPPAGASATVTLELDRTFTAPPDTRQLGVILTEIGFD